MKLAKVVVSFDEGGPPSVAFSALGTEFKVVYSRRAQGLHRYMHTTILPEALNSLGDDQNLPDEVECILAEAEILMRYVGHYLNCGTHRDELRSTIKAMHEVLEKSKVQVPHLTEMTLEGVVVALSTGLSVQEAIALGMLDTRLVHKKPTEEEEKIIATAMERVGGTGATTASLPADLVASVVLDYECCIPAITDADRAFYGNAEQSHAAMSTHPNHIH